MATASEPTPSGADLLQPEPLVVGGPDVAALHETCMGYLERPASRGAKLLFLALAGGTLLFALAVFVTVAIGVGTWGINMPVAWAFAITNFVWWIGIGHAGTLISAILLLFLQRWRTSINRFAEAMTLFAVVCAGMFPLLHLGRPWFAFWLIPYPSRTGLWPQFRSALVWDVFAISTYLTVSFLFWYLGLLPDLATARDHATRRWRRTLYGLLALGWRGSARHWLHYRAAYWLLAGLATPLVLSVHTVVSFDFATTLLPGWHETIFPPYFVAGAVFSGFAMVMTLLVPARRLLHLESVVTLRHLENMNKMILAMCWVVAYSYIAELFVGWYSGTRYEWYTTLTRAGGPYKVFYWLVLLCNVGVPQLFWARRCRRSVVVMWLASIAIQVGMWCERFVIIVTSLYRDFLPSSWRMYYPTWVDLSLLVGTISFFGLCFLLFLRLLPAIPLSELKELRAELLEEQQGAGAGVVP